MIFRRLLLFCLMVLSAGTLRAADKYLRDSLLLRLKDTPHNELRLKILDQLVGITDENMDECRKYNQQLLKEAELQNNGRYKCEAYFTEVIFAYNTYNVEKLQEITDLLIPLARKEKCYDLMFRTWRCKIDFLILTQDLERNEQEAKKMLAEAQRLKNDTGLLESYQCYANIYRATHRPEDAIAILEKAKALGGCVNKSVKYLINIWQQLLTLYYQTGNYSKWLALLKEAEKSVLSLPPNEISTQHLTLLTLYSSYTEYYLETEDIEQAKYYMHRAETFLNDSSAPLYHANFYRICAQVYFHSKQYGKALEKVDAALSELQGDNSEVNYYRILVIKADILSNMNRHQEAIRLFKETIAYNDSLQVVTINKQYQLLKNDFRADRLRIEEAELQHRQQIYTLLLLAIGLAVIAGFIIYVLHSHRILRKAEQEMLAMNHQMELVNEAKNRFLSNISNTIRKPLNIVVDGSLHLANHQISDAAEQQHLSVSIRQMAGDLLKIINDILDLSRLEAGMMKLEKSDIEATSMLYDAISSTQIAESPIEIRTEYPENTLFMVCLDSNRLMQVFKSLLYPDNVPIHVLVRQQEESLQICITGSALVRRQLEQETIIRNEINRMLIDRFGGTYTILPDEICLTLPINQIIRP